MQTFSAYIESKLSLYSYCSINAVNLNEPLVNKIRLECLLTLLISQESNCEFHANKDGNKFNFFHDNAKF